ncbi:unnamed protein product [Chrysodeixis includens]|uniref:Uncharacterized protein n=1 Tax=Chrysodeixis includens TaxID=689277 RepID=A0A9P0BH66_CHRIL|nr:unnamed protein product [Chrysodeixis includens]
MEVENHFRKFKLLLDYVFEGKVVLDERSIEQLLFFLENPTDKSNNEKVLDTPRFSDLIFEAIKNIPNATISVTTFLIEIVTILFKNELQFSKLQMQGFQKSTIQYCIIGVLEPKIPPPGLQLVCIKLAAAQITHCSGIRLVMENKVWKSILCSSIHQRPRHIANEAYKFISALIQKLSDYNLEADLTEVLGYIVKPITSSEYLQLEEIDPETDKLLSEKIKTYLNALLVILSDTGNSDNNLVVNLLRSYFLVDHPLYTIMLTTRFTDFTILINDINHRYFYASLRQQLFAGKSDDVCNELVAYYHNTMKLCIKKREMRPITDFCIKYIIFWSNFEKIHKDQFEFPLTFERNGHKLVLSNQLLAHLMAPIFHFTYYNQSSQSHNSRTFEDFVEESNRNVLDTLSDHILSTCYLMKSLFETLDLKQVVIETAKELFRLKNHLSNSQAGMLFQALYHAVNIFIVSDGEGKLILNENRIQSSDDEKLLSLLLDLIRMLLKDHNISWYENVEIVSLQQGLMNLLKQGILNSKQVIKVLDLIDICVKKFLSPNMTLLVESRQDSTLNEIGTLMKTYLQHDDWEVRDSALNLLYSCIDVAYIKYTPLQKIIRDDNLACIAAKLAISDPEYYVQSASLKCLTVSTRIESVWRSVIQEYPHICLLMVYILKNNPEGMVRKEAAYVLVGIYLNKKVSQNFQQSLYDVMMTAALDDLHSEVQMAALFFWGKVIKNQLALRGMLDGKFPPVTFSREKRKIITLNDQEIARQLTFIMNDLSSSGCFTVLLECMNEINDIEIIQSAHCYAKKLMKILDTYKFQKVVDNKRIPTPPPEPNITTEKDQEIAMDLSYETTCDQFRNKIIDEIVSEYQSELIMSMHDRYQEIKSEPMDEDYKSIGPRRPLVHPNKFIETFRSTDYETIIKNKKQWNADVHSSFDVLLDDLLDI